GWNASASRRHLEDVGRVGVKRIPNELRSPHGIARRRNLLKSIMLMLKLENGHSSVPNDMAPVGIYPQYRPPQKNQQLTG
ncbi:hypothetical protein, partial [Mesorhizobium sp.]|uniref:hypothetical protein n=1 Tax=Mesorhizobium sp. TaxID=1871066 RepID=UPI0025E69D1C